MNSPTLQYGLYTPADSQPRLRAVDVISNHHESPSPYTPTRIYPRNSTTAPRATIRTTSNTDNLTNVALHSSESSPDITTPPWAPLRNFDGYFHGYLPRSARPKRHRKVMRDNVKSALNKPTIRRLARRGGVKRIQSAIYDTVQQVVYKKLREMIDRLVSMVNLANRKTVTALDVVYVLKAMGTPIYGFGMIEHGMLIADHKATYARKKQRLAESIEMVRLDHEAEERRMDAWQRRMQRGARG